MLKISFVFWLIQPKNVQKVHELVHATKLRTVKEIATDLPKRLSHYKAAEIITQHVRDNCDCLPLTAFEKWNNELKTSPKKDTPVKLFE